MSAVANLTSVANGKCSKHKSTKTVTVLFVTGAGTVLTNGSPTVTLASIGIATCGHPVVVLTTSGTVNAEGSGVVRVGDVVATIGGTQVVLTGSGNTNSG